MPGIHSNPNRYYRRNLNIHPDETTFQVVLEETDLWITAEKDFSIEALDYVQKLRSELKQYINLHNQFLHALEPIQVYRDSPEIVHKMAVAAKSMGVGPMAAVAGTIAHMLAEKFVKKSPNLLVENGGDIFLCSTRNRTVGLLADPGQKIKLGVQIPAAKCPCSLCASSSTIGHSLSFGQGDLVAVMAENGSLADAAATSLANMLSGKKGLDRMLARAQKLKNLGIWGVFAQKGKNIGAWGDLELINIPDD
ncbi:MAG: UPF0280 family protein [Thermodesulfobacteriota bacterium]